MASDILDFVLSVENLPPNFFRVVFLDCQNDGISQDVVFQIRCFGRDKLDISSWGLKKAKIIYRNNLLFSGLLISGENDENAEYDGFYYEFVLSSPLYLFKTVGMNRVFVNKSLDEIIDLVFLSRGWKLSQWRWKLENNLAVLPMRVQYNQSDYDFIMDLMAEFKICFIFESGILYLSDNINFLNKPYKYKAHHIEEHEKYMTKTSNIFLGYDFQPRPRVSLLKATIEGVDPNFPHLNSQGYYFIRFLFDESSEFLQGSCPVPVISPCLMNFTLKPGTEVAVRFLEGDINRPLIAGVFIDDLAREADKYIQKSHSGHEFMLSPQNIQITHANLGNRINIAEDISVEAQYGEIELNAGKNISLYTPKDFDQVIGKDKLVNIQKNFLLKSTEGNIEFNAAKNISFAAEYKINLKCPKNIIFKAQINNFSGENIVLKAKYKIDLMGSYKIIMLGNNIIGEASGGVLLQAAGANLIGSVSGMILNTAVLTVNALEITGVPMVI